MADLVRMLLRAPLKTICFTYTFSVLCVIELSKRLFLPWLPVYQPLRIRLYRAYWAACNAHYPELIHRLPIKDDEVKARLVHEPDFKAYIIPGTESLADASTTADTSNVCIALYAHGGGYARGEARMYIRYMERWRNAAHRRGIKLVFFSVEYPLTDVSIYPTQLDAFIAAYRYLLSLDIPPDRIVFMGDSAGGGLSVLCGLRLQNLALPQPVSYILLSPWLDHSGENFEGGCPMVETDYLIYANEMVPHFSRLWCGPYPGDAPDVNPLYLPPEAVSGLSPQLVLVGAAEFAVHESVSWGKLCERAGVRCRVVREWGMMHIYALGSLWLPYEVRTRTVETIVDWIESSMNNGSQHNGAYKLVDA